MAQEKQLLDAGAAKVILQGVKDADDAINRAKHARGNVDSVPIDADPFNRDNDKWFIESRVLRVWAYYI